MHTHVPLDCDIPPARQPRSQHIGHAKLTGGQGNVEKQIHHVHTHVPLDCDIPPARQPCSQHIGHAELTSGQGHSPAY